MLTSLVSFRRSSAVLLSAVVVILCLFTDGTASKKVRDGSDPSIMKVDDNYYGVPVSGSNVVVLEASSLEGLGDATENVVWSDDGKGEIWAPEISKDGDTTYIYFSAGTGSSHRMYAISADSPLGTYPSETKLELPDDKWAIDGALFNFKDQRWFVWSGWATDKNSEQDLYICKMNSPTEPTGSRTIISQPREKWETGDKPAVNEGPEVIVDPDGQLHIVYSANGSWGDKYCIAELRLKKDGDPTKIWDWYKSNGCLFGSHQDRMMDGWSATQSVDGPGHHTFALPNGDINHSPSGDGNNSFMFHAVPKGTKYSWDARAWYTGNYVWQGNTTYSRKNSPGAGEDTGYSIKFFEADG
ncbi:Uu.00g101820.m01.CDS01 [Anthostomella pinea]|uniref:Uu.00g101820.m01.CDS01 n=1 Tax=Anthostomella pinea TaxID=933095 RepID=A0AAI8YFG5_9PEZI|nr:Uu.00g101820.m01.CDS01 [Anthostomella pinea]